MKLESLHDLYIHELQDLHSAETQIKAALPKAIKAVNSDDLKTALKNHLEETKTHVDRLNQILKRHGAKLEDEKCEGMEGLLAECESMMDKDADEIIFDLGIISGCQRIEHYEIAGYGMARAFAEKLGEEEDAALLAETLEEESSADDGLTGVATVLLGQCNVESEEDEDDESSGFRSSRTKTREMAHTR